MRGRLSHHRIAAHRGLPVSRRVHSTCPYCGVGCGIAIEVDERDRIAWVDDEPDNPSSVGMLCVKGRFGTTFANHPDRLTVPLVRRNGRLAPASWDEALDLIARRLPAYRESGEFGSFASARQRTKTPSSSKSSCAW